MIDTRELARQIANDLHYAFMDETEDYHVDKEEVIKDCIDYYLENLEDDGK